MVDVPTNCPHKAISALTEPGLVQYSKCSNCTRTHTYRVLVGTKQISLLVHRHSIKLKLLERFFITILIFKLPLKVWSMWGPIRYQRQGEHMSRGMRDITTAFRVEVLGSVSNMTRWGQKWNSSQYNFCMFSQSILQIFVFNLTEVNFLYTGCHMIHLTLSFLIIIIILSIIITFQNWNRIKMVAIFHN